MKDLSLYVLDITMNSVRAGATVIYITLRHEGSRLTFSVKDNGCGMTAEQVQRLKDPFFTTRKTRGVGLGVPFLTMLARQTGGDVHIESVPREESNEHGTLISAEFDTSHIDFIPLGNLAETLVTLIQGSPDTDFVYSHTGEGYNVSLDTREMRQVLGEDVPLSCGEVLGFIREYLREQYDKK